jgi:hypothetical protein
MMGVGRVLWHCRLIEGVEEEWLLICGGSFGDRRWRVRHRGLELFGRGLNYSMKEGSGERFGIEEGGEFTIGWEARSKWCGEFKQWPSTASTHVVTLALGSWCDL